VPVHLVAWWIAIGSACLIVYGSLFPFRFGDDGGALLTAALHMSFRRTTRGDIVANLLLYLPLGLGLAMILRPRYGRLASLVGAVAAGLSLSFAIEVIQAYEVTRVSSLTDVLLNGAGTAAGAVAGLLQARFASLFRVADARDPAAEPAALLVLLLWLSFRLAPFVPTIDWQKYKDALKPLFLGPDLRALSVFAYVVGWLVVKHALQRSGRGANGWGAFALVAAVVLAGRVVIVDKALSLSELVALPLCVPLAAWLERRGERRQFAWLTGLVVAVVVLQGLEPFALSPAATDFGWLPFRSSLTGRLDLGYTVLFEKAFWYTALIWLWARAGGSVAAAGVATAALLAGIEIAQMWLPGRSPELTDPLLALAFAVLLHVVTTSPAAAVARPPDRALPARETTASTNRSAGTQ
jgi:VanZ family protein